MGRLLVGEVLLRGEVRVRDVVEADGNGCLLGEVGWELSAERCGHGVLVAGEPECCPSAVPGIVAVVAPPAVVGRCGGAQGRGVIAVEPVLLGEQTGEQGDAGVVPDAVDGVHELRLREPGDVRYQHEWRMWQGGRRG